MSTSTDVVTALDVALRVAAALESIGCEYFEVDQDMLCDALTR